ncbi:hypothetical protein CJD36_021165 [Flavipsychrobacter stenotrophus]|uniref:Secretion system C-terminal sorting domain-containing protein n=1 Tax=Flavipsychrobacter stenotrophus TaxID=2077091 RepID=A0A2S7SQT2_9BACT|nr:T9SS type A sorting domain-containing protein [Flavipsychrobacter stenotrophus]PQJ09088.1 hypothetical protein CJD36_021165 [Flavipsychrobacter stenotrophus]
MCSGAPLTLTGAAASPITTTYFWTGPDGYSSSVLNPVSLITSSLSAGVYTLTTTNVCGSTSANTGSVNVISTPTSVSASAVTSSLCTGATLSLIGAATGATSYFWSGPGGYSAGLLNPASFVTTAGSSGVYTLTVGNSCFTVTATTSVILTPLPAMAAITGTTTVCAGSNTTLSDVVPGGVWSSGDLAIATVSGVGAVFGVAAGSAIISYATTNSCGTALATTTVTVVPIPTFIPIAGSSLICQSSTALYTNGIPGGTWSSSNPAIATIDVTGVVTGTNVGNAVISYTVNNGCGAPTTDTLAISIITLPDAGNIFGPVRLCMSDTIRLYNYTTGGTWYLANNHASITSIGGLVTGITSGVDTAYYVLNNTCGTDTARFAFYIYTPAQCAALGVAPIAADGISCGIYPNPNTGSFTLSGSWIPGDNEAIVEILDLLGQVVYKKSFILSNGKIDEQVQLDHNFTSGLYLVHINSVNAHQVIRCTISQ